MTLAQELPAGSDQVSVSAHGSVTIDALLLQPLVTSLDYGGDGVFALLHSAASTPRTLTVTLPGSGPTTVRSYDSDGRLVTQAFSTSATVRVPVLPGGFSTLRR